MHVVRVYALCYLVAKFYGIGIGVHMCDKPCSGVQCYISEVLDVHSGDDLILMVDLNHDNLYKRVRARLKGVDTPDAYQSKIDTEAGRIREYVRSVTYKKKCRIAVHGQNRGSGGWLVTLYLGLDDTAQSLNEILQEQGYIFRG